MSTYCTLLVLLLLLRENSARDKNVVSLSDSSFANQLKKHNNLLVMFFVPWSGACQKFRPHYKLAAETLTANKIAVTLGKMDCSAKGKVVCSSKNIQTFPTFGFYQNGHFVKRYSGSRDYKSLVRFMRVQVMPDVTELKDVYEFKSFLSSKNDVVVVGFFEEESRLKRMFFKVGKEMKESMIFAHSANEKLLRRQGVVNGIVLFRPTSLHNFYEEERILFTGGTVIGEIKNFIIKNYHGLVGHRTPTNKWDFANPLVVVYYLADYENAAKAIDYWRLRVMKVAHKYKGKVRFAISAIDEFEEEVAEFGRNAATLKPIVIGRDLESQRYVMDADFSTEDLDRFVRAFLSKKIEPYQRSDLTSVENDGDVIIVVANNFERVVLNSTKDVLLQMYVNQSEKSHEMIRVVRKVANLLKEENLLMVRMDASDTELPAMFNAKDLPNVFWLGMKNKKSPVLYEGQGTVNDLIKFVAKKATKQLYAFNRYGVVRTDKDEL